MPWIYVREIHTCLSFGMSTPAIRATPPSPILTLPLLVPRVLADDPHDAVAADDLAFLAARFHRRLNLHTPPPAVTRFPSAERRRGRRQRKAADATMPGLTGHAAPWKKLCLYPARPARGPTMPA